MPSVASVLDKCPYAAGESLKRKNIDEKRQLVHELSNDSDSAFDVLMKWGRAELLQVLCAELGERKNKTRLKKDQIINKLLKVVSEKKDSSTTTERNSKRQRKNVSSVKTTKGKDTLYCTNLACQDKVSREDIFCRRCSCCICGDYDSNKDPSIWLACDYDPPFTCGFSCHLECALKSEKSGIKEDEPSHAVDGCYYCVSCGRTNSLLECWEKQLTIATETTRVDVLCSRLVLAQKLLKGTEKYTKLSEPVGKAVKCLETELGGPLNDLPSMKRRGNVTRLASAPNVKDLCSSALTLFDALTKIRFEDVDATSLTLILGSEKGTSSKGYIIHYRVWHRKASEKDYTEKLTCALVSPKTRYVVSGLTPATEYCFKVVSFRGLKETSVVETKVSTKTSQEEETTSSEKEKQLALKETVIEKAVGVSNGESSSDRGLEFEDCVGVLRQLELGGNVDTEFRLKFLTWYGLHANSDKKNLVKGFVNQLVKDPKALADQLIRTFSDLI
ncbi:VIN3-like protein 2 isoform X1 [Raphanus sativus]|uniref:VIN3-like protein 2 isoform X1 n=2 Tax=Raphanus sativus TaxID=3726 RepID=A0A6J0JJN4_RAPSA|nr:VIN3-like protein 2 isoform X1 [Raphanus sativus]XP_056844806.1 VIN3-like protein 2 isoform X1 [Raphanus sativus]